MSLASLALPKMQSVNPVNERCAANLRIICYQRAQRTWFSPWGATVYSLAQPSCLNPNLFLFILRIL